MSRPRRKARNRMTFPYKSGVLPVDFHTHILPGTDDGSRGYAEGEQGVMEFHVDDADMQRKAVQLFCEPEKTK